MGGTKETTRAFFSLPTRTLSPCVWPGCLRLLSRGGNSEARWEHERDEA